VYNAINRVIVEAQAFQNSRAQGQAMVEYGLILVLVSVVAVAVLTNVGTDLSAVFNNVDTKLQLPG
jgi:pilus assembly protein Flp/PilA